MEFPKFSLTVASSDYAIPLGFEVWVNDHCVFDCAHVKEPQTITGELPNDELASTHQLKFLLKNKLPQHTRVSSTGEIDQDAMLIVDNLMFDGIDIGFIATKLCVYHHNFNGHGSMITDQFFGNMGCNGTVVLPFCTPVYLWLLENM